MAHEAPDLGCAWVASYAAICSDLQAWGAEVMAKKDPLTDLLIRGSRVRIPDGSPRNRLFSFKGVRRVEVPVELRLAKKKKAADPRAAAFSRAGSFVSTASLAR